jgi:hypothetical protein
MVKGLLISTLAAMIIYASIHVERLFFYSIFIKTYQSLELVFPVIEFR